MKTNLPPSRRNRRAFTLVELLVVIGIIAILAAMILAVLAVATKHAKVVKAQLEISQLVTAIEGYDSAYGRFPVSPAVQSVAGANQNNAAKQNGDFTFGGTFQTPGGPQPIGTVMGGGLVLSNAEVIAVLMDLTNYPGTSVATINTNYQSNPQQTIFLRAHMSGYDPSQPGTPLAGVGTDLVYRDPWGNPYIITMDLNYDGLCEDQVYSSAKVSSATGAGGGSGLNGLVQAPDGNYAYHGKVMVWSAGPDGKIDPNASANQGMNKDNILSWK